MQQRYILLLHLFDGNRIEQDGMERSSTRSRPGLHPPSANEKLLCSVRDAGDVARKRVLPISFLSVCSLLRGELNSPASGKKKSQHVAEHVLIPMVVRDSSWPDYPFVCERMGHDSHPPLCNIYAYIRSCGVTGDFP